MTLSELEEAFELANFEPYGTVETWIDRETGKVYVRSDDITCDDDEEPLPEDIDRNERYLALPDRRELDLGRPLALEFAHRFLERDVDTVRDMFSHRGAYGRFKTLLARRAMLDQWHAFEAEATRDALKTWAQDSGLALTEPAP